MNDQDQVIREKQQEAERMAEQVYREKSVERISSPEQLNDYLKVTKPAVWIALLAVILLLAGFFVWGIFAHVGSYASGRAEVKNGAATVVFSDSFAKEVQAGMDVTIEGTSFVIAHVGYDSEGNVTAEAETTLADGTYDARVLYKETKIWKLLFE